MKATILLGTLKTKALSNTEVLCDFLTQFLEKEKIECTIIRLVNYKILAGTYSDMGNGDEWPTILNQLESSDIIIFASPIWWNNISSEIQRVIERLDELHDEIMAGKESRFAGKVGGLVVTGDSDGAENLISGTANFFNFIGLTFPPFAALTVLSPKQAKSECPTREELMALYEKTYTSPARVMTRQLVKYSKMLNEAKA